MPRPVQQLAIVWVHCFYSPVVGLGQPRHAVVPWLERQAVGLPLSWGGPDEKVPHRVAIDRMEFQLNSYADDLPHVVSADWRTQLDCIVAWGG